MKQVLVLLIPILGILTGCQKSVNDFNVDNGTSGNDSIIRPGDTISYEIITADTTGWAGIWNDPDGTIASNPLDSVNFGSPVYYKSGWRHSFICPSTPFQAFISAANILYNQDITANLYNNGKLIKSVKNDAMQGVTKFLVSVDADTLKGTASDPVLTYEVLLTGADSNQFEADGWIGQWNMPDGKVSDFDNPLLQFYAMSSGWKFVFKPEHLPFTMYVGASPYIAGTATITVNFYVNGKLVKKTTSQNYTYGNTYVVQ